MSRPPAKPLQRTPRAPLLAPAPEPTPSATNTTEGLGQHPKAGDLTQQPRQLAPTQHETPPPAPEAPRAAMEEKFLSVRVPKDLHRRIRAASLNHDLPIRQIVLSAVTTWLDQHDKR